MFTRQRARTDCVYPPSRPLGCTLPVHATDTPLGAQHMLGAALLSLATATHTRTSLQLKPSALVRARHRCVVLQAEPTASRRGRLRFSATRGPASWLETKDGPWSPGYWVEIEGGPDDGRDVVVELADIGPGLKEGSLCAVVLREDGSGWRCFKLDGALAPEAAQPADSAAWREIVQKAARPLLRPLGVVAATVALGSALSQFAPRPDAQESLLRVRGSGSGSGSGSGFTVTLPLP